MPWKYLPDDISNLIFLEYCDFRSFVNSRILQAKYVQECTESNFMERAIQANNLKNMKWIVQYSKEFQWKSSHFHVHSSLL